MSLRRLVCPECQTMFEVEEAAAGRSAPCPTCGWLVSASAPGQSLWYYARHQQKFGPVPLAHLQGLLASGQLQPTDMVLQEGARRWMPISSVAELAPAITEEEKVPQQPKPTAEVNSAARSAQEADQGDGATAEEVRRLKQLLAECDKELEAQRKRLEDQERRLRQLAEQLEAEREEMAQYEAELNEERRRLERDRQTLDEEMEQLRIKNEELTHSLREYELEMSRERATLARERHQLNRLRDELRMELERAERDFEMRQSLARVQGLKGEIQGGTMPPPPTKGEGGALPQRLRDIRQKLKPSDEP